MINIQALLRKIVSTGEKKVERHEAKYAKYGEIDDFDAWLREVLVDAYFEARRGKRRSFDEHKIEVSILDQIRVLILAIKNRSYLPSRSIVFIITDPKIREIFAAAFIDRIAHHGLFAMTYLYWNRRLDVDSYSCRYGKGTLYGILRTEHHYLSCSKNFKYRVFFVKFDIQGFFMSLPRKKLKQAALDGLKKQFAGNLDSPKYKTLKFLWDVIIMDDPVQRAVRRGSLKDWEKLPPTKSLYNQPPGQGIVIGNLTSQLLSNIYLDKLDRFVKHTLGYRHYGRYVDDFYIMVREGEEKQLLRDVEVIRRFLKEELGLTLHPKKIHSGWMDQGMEFIGARIFPGYIIPTDRTKNKFRKNVFDLVSGSGKVRAETIQSELSYLNNFNSFRFVRQTFFEAGQKFGDEGKWIDYLEEYIAAGPARKPALEGLMESREAREKKSA